MIWFWKPLAYLWASPWTLVGIVVGLLGLVSGVRVQRVGGVLEFHGGLVSSLLSRTPVGAAAMTLGHVILGRSLSALDVTREHELVHVGQYERWGLFFIPAYLGASAYLWVAGRDAYHENPFERQAYEQAP